ncbi:S8 family peptidase [Streptomyces cocklensis]|jgi:subtilisin family serine protease|uniref:Peptidase inhibitor I9 n=1 Tax=Actinacidiphila cocklensis TaxID=887465 RepID=A0A9W4DT60_9ACTN|nr:S8 family peptidase [Actinacidiphila cocklensis]MDD1057154.1 S8 family peptidase [Actinacidiphila cocklensis]WSX78316.1 S8 family peptidase [Streptomyces sp. NBC_00899]CAG6395110.1 Peptidase inhibitor I9 [Actinacidiphila cocklensis]
MRLFARGLSAAAMVLAPLTVAATPAVAAIPLPTPAATLAPLRTHDDALAGQYIVTVQKAFDPSAMAQKSGVKPFFTYSSALRGFAVSLNSRQLDAVRRMSGVEAVEENATVTAYDLAHTTDTTVPSAPAAPAALAAPAAAPSAVRAAASDWGLDRIDQHNLPLDGQFNTVGKGAGATAYIMDTGIDFGHSEFGGRAVPGFDAIGDGRNGQDCQGHGTHVAGTVGGATYGVAPQANLVSVRVLDCDGSGSWAGVIAGFDWVAKNAKQPAVLNASLGGSSSTAVNDAATALADAGVLPVVAAGNSSADACNFSPAGAVGVFAVGASTSADQQASFSNFGKCLSLYAPGQNITSAKLGGGSIALDGTSMASPHAAGVALLYKAANPTADAQTVGDWVASQGTENVLSVTAGSPNRLLYTGGL